MWWTPWLQGLSPLKSQEVTSHETCLPIGPDDHANIRILLQQAMGCWNPLVLDLGACFGPYSLRAGQDDGAGARRASKASHDTKSSAATQRPWLELSLRIPCFSDLKAA